MHGPSRHILVKSKRKLVGNCRGYIVITQFPLIDWGNGKSVTQHIEVLPCIVIGEFHRVVFTEQMAQQYYVSKLIAAPLILVFNFGLRKILLFTQPGEWSQTNE